jgi:hypothetical protein
MKPVRRSQMVALIVNCSAVAVLFTVLPQPTSAIPIEGAPIIVATDGHVIATFQGRSPGTVFSNDLYLESPSGFSGIIFNNFSSTVGSTVDLGFFTAGTELIFRLDVNPGPGLSFYDRDFYSGPGSRNPDGLAHTRVDDEWMSGQTLVEWEDLFGAPEGSAGFNDLFFSFTNVRSTPPPTVPDGGSTVALMGLAMIALIGWARKRDRQ